MRNLLDLLEKRPAQNDYEEGLLDLLRYCVNGIVPSDPRWDAYTARYAKRTGVGSSHGPSADRRA